MSRQTPEHTTPSHPAATGIIFLTVGKKAKEKASKLTL